MGCGGPTTPGRFLAARPAVDGVTPVTAPTQTPVRRPGDRRRPRHPATGYLLDRAAYTDAGWFGREQARLFARTWALVGDADRGRARRVPHHRRRRAAHRDVGEDGIRAFHNMCRHRGMVMLDGRRDVPGHPVRLPRLALRARRVVAGRAPAGRAVPRARRRRPWGCPPPSPSGRAWCSPAPTPASPRWRRGWRVPRRHRQRAPGLVPQVAVADIPAACNWKLFVENHIDVYHLWYLHALSLADFEHRRFEHRAVGPTGSATSPAGRPTGPPGSTAATRPSPTSTTATATASAPTCCSPTSPSR